MTAPRLGILAGKLCEDVEVIMEHFTDLVLQLNTESLSSDR